jgi:hypothetical protein
MSLNSRTIFYLKLLRVHPSHLAGGGLETISSPIAWLALNLYPGRYIGLLEYLNVTVLGIRCVLLTRGACLCKITETGEELTVNHWPRLIGCGMSENEIF